MGQNRIMPAAKVIDFASYRQQQLARQQAPVVPRFSYVYLAYWTFVPVVFVAGFA